MLKCDTNCKRKKKYCMCILLQDVMKYSIVRTKANPSTIFKMPGDWFKITVVNDIFENGWNEYYKENNIFDFVTHNQ